jgi:myo-inositol-1(or 4)-monophosphatase
VHIEHVCIGGNELQRENKLDRRFEFLAEVIQSAGDVVRTACADSAGKAFAMKGPQDFLTETDLASEEHIRTAIAAAFPDDSFFGEEGGGSVDGDVWIVDPIDGTANFARRINHFCISIGFVEKGVPQLAAIFNPMSDELYLARRDAGATLNGKPLKVAATTDAAAASVELGWSTRVPNSRYMAAMTGLLDQGFNVRRCGSGALALAHVADGRSDGYVELHMNSWDCVPGLLLVAEAGGAVCPFMELGDLRSGGPVLAAAPGVSARISAAVGIPLEAERSVAEVASAAS